MSDRGHMRPGVAAMHGAAKGWIIMQNQTSARLVTRSSHRHMCAVRRLEHGDVHGA